MKVLVNNEFKSLNYTVNSQCQVEEFLSYDLNVVTNEDGVCVLDLETFEYWQEVFDNLNIVEDLKDELRKKYDSELVYMIEMDFPAPRMGVLEDSEHWLNVFSNEELIAEYVEQYKELFV